MIRQKANKREEQAMKRKKIKMFTAALAIVFAVTAHGATGSSDWFFVDTTDKPKPPTLSVESADWAYGTITLRCEDANVGIANAPFYNLLYFDTAKDEWCNVDRDDLLIPYPSVESNGAGGEMLVTRITDKKFAKRNNGFGTVKYSIYDDDDNARMATCVTRNRHGLFVALDEYADGERLPMVMHEASVFRDAYKKYGDACGYISVMNGAGAYKSDILARLEYVAENKAHAGDVFVFYYVGHGGGHYVTCYGNGEELSASELITRLHKFPNGTGIVVVLNTCFAAGMISREDVADGMGNIGWIVAAQSDQNAKAYTFTKCLCNNGWFFGDADIRDENIGTYGNDDGLVTFGELAMYGQQWSAFNNVGQIMSFYNSTTLNNIVAGKIPFNSKSDQEWIWSTAYPSVYAASNGDIATAAAMPAANGCRTVGECYALGIDPEDPNDDLKITDFEMKDGKPVITLNHTEDGSGNSFLPRVKTLGKANLADSTEEWREVPEGGDPSMRFFKVEVEMP